MGVKKIMRTVSALLIHLDRSSASDKSLDDLKQVLQRPDQTLRLDRTMVTHEPQQAHIQRITHFA